jgi:hypothetical protein
MTDPTKLLGQASPAGGYGDGCIDAPCFCLTGPDKKCVAVLHVDKDGDPCVCLKAADGTASHTKLSALLALVPKTT